MIETYGQGTPGDVARRVFHHAPGVGDTAFALLAGLWVHEAHTDLSRRHRLHFGKGANGVTLHLDNGEKFAFRGRQGHHGYNRVEVLDAPRNGRVLLTLQGPEDSERFFALLSEALTADRAAVA